MQFQKCDQVIFLCCIVLSFAVFSKKLIVINLKPTIPNCLPCSKIFYSSPRALDIQFDEVLFEKVLTLDNLKVQKESDAIRILFDENLRECSHNVSEEVIKCGFFNKPDELFDSLNEIASFSIDFAFDSENAGLFACRAVKEITKIAKMHVSSEWKNWKVIFPDCKQTYFDYFEKHTTELRGDELFAILMPLLLPPSVMFLRVLRKRH